MADLWCIFISSKLEHFNLFFLTRTDSQTRPVLTTDIYQDVGRQWALCSHNLSERATLLTVWLSHGDIKTSPIDSEGISTGKVFSSKSTITKKYLVDILLKVQGTLYIIQMNNNLIF